MNFFRRTMPQIVLPLVLTLSLLLGSVSVSAASTTSIPPTATAINLKTYGALPVMVLNLTQSNINIDISSTNPNHYTTSSGPGLPIAIGLSGVSYLQSNGYTPTLTNPYSPGTAVNGSISASLMPVASVATAATPQWNFMNMFTLFPSWTGRATFNNVQYVGLTNLENQGAAAYSYNVVSGYPNGNGSNISVSGDYTSAKALNAAAATGCSINLHLQSGNVKSAAYSININSLGAGSSDNAPPPAKTSILSVLNNILTVVGDVMVVLDPTDVFFKTSMAIGALSSLQSMQGQIPNQTPNAYTATSKGINVSASASFYIPNGDVAWTNETFTLYQGDTDALTYTMVQTGSNNYEITEAQNNAVFITTWRQYPQNTSSIERNPADLLIVAVINQSLYSSQQLTQHLAQTVAPTQSKLTREQARDSAKVLSVLSTIRKERPKDAQYIVEMFGIHGKYEEIKKNPNELKALNRRLKEILSPYRSTAQVIEQSFLKL